MNVTTRLRLPLATLWFASTAVILFLSPRASAVFEFARDRVAAGEFWRGLTCHWTHFSASHLFWDLLMFVVLGGICEGRSRRSMLFVIAFSAVIIPAAIWLFVPHLQTYRGLSGIDCALFMLAVRNISDDEHQPGIPHRIHWIVWALVLLFLAKELLEWATNQTVFANSLTGGFVPVPLAHLVGAAVGLLTPSLPICNNSAASNAHQARAFTTF